MEYKFSGSITLKDYIQFNKVVGKKQNIFAAIMLVVWVASYFIIDDKAFKPIWFGTLALALVALIILKPSYKKRYNLNKFLQDEQVFIINEEFIKVTVLGSHTAMTREDGKLVEVVIKDPQSVVAKDKIHKIWFDKDSIYLFTDAYNAFIVKKRYLKDGEFDELKAFLKEHYMLKREK